jgi:hypothetical protein
MRIGLIIAAVVAIVAIVLISFGLVVAGWWDGG